MRNSFLVLALSILFCFCTTTTRLTNEAFQYALVGQNEMTISSRLGAPIRKIPDSDGGQVMIYEFYSKGMFLTPYKSRVTYNAARNIAGNRQGLTFTSGVTRVTNDPKYTIYQNDVSYLKVFLNKQGNCVRFEENLTRDQLETYYEQLRRYVPKGK